MDNETNVANADKLLRLLKKTFWSEEQRRAKFLSKKISSLRRNEQVQELGGPTAGSRKDLGLSHLHVACKLRKNEFVKRFLEHGENPDCQATIKIIYPPLLFAILYGNRELYRLLLKNVADPNRALNEALICSRAGDLGLIAKRFLATNKSMNREVQIDAKDKNGLTPLTTVQNWRQAELLLRRGADVNLTNERGCTPLHCAYLDPLEEAQHKAAMRSLPAQNPESKIGQVREGVDDRRQAVPEIDRARQARGANPNAVDKQRWTVVHVICQRENDDDDDDDSLARTMSRLWDASGQSLKIDVPNGEGFTPLQLAVVFHNIDLAKFLLTRGADPNALHRLRLELSALELFLECCDDRRLRVQLDVADESGKTPLQWAVEKILPNVVRFLLGRGADVSRVVLPTEDHLDERFEGQRPQDRLILAFDFFTVVTCLQKKGYELSSEYRGSIIRTFAKYGMTCNQL
ncbi:hypothetical protein TKK_0004743 [Trichogramma kaykai]